MIDLLSVSAFILLVIVICFFALIVAQEWMVSRYGID